LKADKGDGTATRGMGRGLAAWAEANQNCGLRIGSPLSMHSTSTSPGRLGGLRIGSPTLLAAICLLHRGLGGLGSETVMLVATAKFGVGFMVNPSESN
jgi:hypothetical protein